MNTVNFRVVLALTFRGLISEINRGSVFAEFIPVKTVRCLSHAVSSHAKPSTVVREADLRDAT